MTAAELSPELRKVIDERLEAIDRALDQAQVSWSERRHIVGEVETQIFELLTRRSVAPAQEDVTVVLESIDPPEAWVPDELRDGAAGGSAPARWKVREWPQHAGQVMTRCIPWAAGVLTLVIVNGAIVMIVISSEGVIPWIVTIGGLAWLNYEGVKRFRSWAATRHGNLVDDFCHSLGGWLMSKGSAPAT